MATFGKSYYSDNALRNEIYNTINENHNDETLEKYFKTKILSTGSLKKYFSQLIVLHKLYFNQTPYQTNWKDYENVKSKLIISKPLTKETFIKYKTALIKEIEKMNDEKRRMFYNALFNFTGDMTYQKKMNEANKLHLKGFKDKQKDNTMFDKNEKENENMITSEERDAVLQRLRIDKEEAYRKFNRTGKISKNDFHVVQDFILFMLTSGIYFPIRRSKDWTDFVIDDDEVDVNRDNYYDTSPSNEALVFNSFKTSKTHGTQRLPFKVFKYTKNKKETGFYTQKGLNEVRRELKRFIDLIQEYNNSEYLFQDYRGKKMSDVNITHRLNKIFGGRKVSVNMLKKSDYSMRAGAIFEAKDNYDYEMEKLNFHMTSGGSSISNIGNYVRKD